MKTKKPPLPQYKPANECIYCRRSDVPLSREHIVPYALHGHLVLPKASCLDCATRTTIIEESFLRGIAWGPRILMKLSSRRPRPQTLPVRVDLNEAKKVRHLPLDTYPSVLLMIALDRPGIMQGLPPGADIKRTVWMYNFNADSNKLGSAGVANAFSPTSDLWEFAKMLAKIAHGYTVASLGLNSFRPMLLDMIFDKGAKPFFLVGGSLHIPPPMETDELHYLELSVTDVGHTKYAVATIRLFANLGAPVYSVVVGEIIGNS